MRYHWSYVFLALTHRYINGTNTGRFNTAKFILMNDPDKWHEHWRHSYWDNNNWTDCDITNLYKCIKERSGSSSIGITEKQSIKVSINKRPVGLYSSAAYWNHDDQGKGSSSELDMSEYMFGLDWVCLTTTRPSGHISRRINNVWPMLRQWSFSWSFQDVCLAVLYVRKG